MKKIFVIVLAVAALSSCFRRGGGGQGEPVPAVDTVAISPDTTLLLEDAPEEEMLDEAGNISADPVMAEKPVVKTSSSGEPIIVAGGVVEIDKMVYDFGDFSQNDGPKKCTFTLKNIGKDPLAIYEVLTSCGCTDATWTREPILAGKTGKITLTYKNEDGPNVFDKAITVYLSAVKQPVILRIRGEVHEKARSLDENFSAVRAGTVGFKGTELNAGNMDQGEQRSDQATLANLSRRPVRIAFSEVSSGLSISVSPNPVPARSTAVMSFTVTASRDKWGRNIYTAVPVVDGKAYPSAKLSVRAVTKENFSDWTDEQKQDGSLPFFDDSTVSYGTITRGTPISATFSFVNKGRSDFICHKADSETPGVTVVSPGAVPPGGKGTFRVSVDTSGLPVGDNDIFINLITNSPSRPLVSLFLIGSVTAQ